MAETSVEKKNGFPIIFDELTLAGVNPKKISKRDWANRLEPFTFESGDGAYKIFHVKKSHERSSQFGGQDALLIFNSENKFIGAVTGERFTKIIDRSPSKNDGWGSIFIEAKQIIDSSGNAREIPANEIALNISNTLQTHAVREDYIPQMKNLVSQINSHNLANVAKDNHIVRIPLNITPEKSVEFCGSCYTIPKQPTHLQIDQ